MTRYIYIHLGIGKTGTTALQGFFLRNRSVLLSKNIYIPLTGMHKHEGSHHPLAFSLCGDRFKSDYYNNIETPNYYRSKMKSEVKVFRDSNILLTSEIFPVCKTELHLFVKEVFPDHKIKLVIYLRRQDNLMEANYSQAVKYGEEIRDIDQFIKEVPKWNYRKLIESIKEIFQPEKIIVRPYEKDQFIEESIFADFLYFVFNLKLSNEYVVPEIDSNPRLSRDALELKRLINKFPVDFNIKNLLVAPLLSYSKKVNPNTAKAFKKIDILSPRKRLEIINANLSYYEFIAREYLNREDGILFYEELPDISAEWNEYSGLDPHISIDIVNSVLSRVFSINNRKNIDKLLNSILINGLIEEIKKIN